MKTLVIIPARGGSKGVPGKNIKLLNGKPLIKYTIEAAKSLYSDDQIIVSTDSDEIKQIVNDFGLAVPFIRPKELSNDSVGTYEVLLHAIEFMEAKGIKNDTLILLQPTSPFRTGEHLKEALELYTSDLDMVVSVKETKANPYFVLREEDKNGYLVESKTCTAIRRQDVPKVWELNGAIYIININSLKKMHIKDFTKVKKYVMNEISSHDIDTMFDWKMAEIYFENLNK